MKKPAIAFVGALLLAATGCVSAEDTADVLFLGGHVLDGTGGDAQSSDVAVTGDRISFVGDASTAGVQARDTVLAAGLVITPGFIDMHSHAELGTDHGRDAKAFLYQGITSVALGLDGDGSSEVAATLADWTANGIGVNGMLWVGHNSARREVMGMEDRAPSAEELDAMRTFVRKGMDEGAYGLSSGLFYLPGNYSETEEVIELNKVAAEYPGAIYDTHDRDLGAAYPSFGYLRSIEEGIRIGEEAGTKVIFSHFNAQGAANYGRAPEGAALIEAARARGIEVAGAHHSYTATQSNLRSYTVPSWVVAGGDTAMVRRFDDPDTLPIVDRQTREMLAIRGGADHILFADQRPELNGKTLQDLADEWSLTAPEASRRILREGNAAVMNLGLYDHENTRYLAQLDWMMTCTDGRDPGPTRPVTHPRAFGSFTKKIKDLVIDEELITLAHTVRSMTGLAADFLGWSERGYLREGYLADITVVDMTSVEDMATYENPHQYSRGTVHVMVNGTFALRDGEATDEMPGRALVRGGAALGQN